MAQKSHLRYAMLLLITLVILFLLFLDARDSLHQFKQPAVRPVIAGVLLTGLFPFCMAIRWAATLWAGGYAVSIRKAVEATMGAWPLGTLTPSKTGDLFKAMAVRESVPLSAGLGSVVAERVIDVFVLFALCLGGALILRQTWVAIFAALGMAAVVVGWAMILLEWNLPVGEKWRERFAQFRIVWKALAAHPKYLGLSVAASALNWFLSIWQTQLFFSAYGTQVPITFVCAALPVAIFVGLLPFTIAGMGTRDKALMVLFAPFAPEAVCLSVGILYSISGYWLPSLAGLPFMKHLSPGAADSP